MQGTLEPREPSEMKNTPVAQTNLVSVLTKIAFAFLNKHTHTVTQPKIISKPQVSNVLTRWKPLILTRGSASYFRLYSVSFPELAPCATKESCQHPEDPEHWQWFPTQNTQPSSGRTNRLLGLLTSFFLNICPCLLRPHKGSSWPDRRASHTAP